MLTLLPLADLMSYTWVIVSDEEDATPNENNICNEIMYPLYGLVLTVKCNYKYINAPRRGRYVTIMRNDLFPTFYLIFCEVEVMSCPPGRWGYTVNSLGDCVYACDRCRNESETCRVADGYCFTGCKDEFMGENCDEQCYCADGDQKDHIDGSYSTGKSHQKVHNLWSMIRYTESLCVKSIMRVKYNCEWVIKVHPNTIRLISKILIKEKFLLSD